MSELPATTGVPFVDLQAQYASIKADVDRAVAQVLQRGDFVLGQAVERFEADFAAYLGVGHACGVGNGGDAIELALRACGIGPGDEVITAANTFIATVQAIAAAGATPVLVDVDPLFYTIDPDAAAAAVTPRTRAIVPVHLYGQPADMGAVQAIAARHDLVVVEDAAQAHGARERGRRAGSAGRAAAFSFYPSKNLGAAGDGGMVVTSDADVANRVRLLRNYGQQAKYSHVTPGRNSRLDTLQAAVLAVKLRRLDEWNAARRRHAESYRERLEGRVRVPAVRPGAEHVFHLFVVEVDGRDDVQRRLGERQIHTGIHYPVPVHLQPACAPLGYRAGDFPVTEAAAARILSLPMYPELTEAQIDYVCEALISST